MASAALNALAEQRHRRHLQAWSQRVPWYPWTLTGLTAGASILLSWLHPAIPLDPPPGWLVSLVYGLPPLAAVFAWHLFLQRLAHPPPRRRARRPGRRRPARRRAGPGAGPGVGRAARGRPRPARPRDPRSSGDRPAGPGRDRAVPLPRLRRPARLRAEVPSRNGHAPTPGRHEVPSSTDAAAP